MAVTNLNNFVIDRVLRGIALSHTDGSVLFSINQITNPSLNCSSESTDAVDALGTPIATFYRAKNAEFSAENAIFDMNLMAVQLGTMKKEAASDKKIVAPAFEIIDVTAEKTATLKHTPKGELKTLYKLNGDSTLGAAYSKATDAAADKFALTGTALKLPTGLAEGDQVMVIYEYEAEKGVAVVNSANNFPTGCKFVMEVLGCDVCDQTNLIYAYLVFPNFKISPDFDWNIATDGTHPFSGKAMQDYCSKDNKLFEIIIPE